MKILFLLVIVFLYSCSTTSTTLKTSKEIMEAKNWPSGYLSIIQGETSANHTYISIFSPRLKNYQYKVTSPDGKVTEIKPFFELEEKNVFYKVVKLKIENLLPNTNYKLEIIDSFKEFKTVIDTRYFQTIDINKKDTTFALLSCISDDFRFREIIPTMWKKIENKNVDFILITGDVVYVDDFQFVQRQKANSFDIWQRYIDSFQVIPVFHWKNLKPILATWDDHDYGTNDSDKNFISKNVSNNLYHALFFGEDFQNIIKHGPTGVSREFHLFGHNFYLMDDRFEREEDKGHQNDLYGHWGKNQHEWLIEKLKNNPGPSYIVNGNQLLSGTDLSFKEAMISNHSAEFKLLMQELKEYQWPVAFLSGDIHFSEIMAYPKEEFGFATYEFTSSSMHSFINKGWDNKYRIPGTFVNEFNFMLINSKAQERSLEVHVDTIGTPDTPYFSKDFKITK